ncbi:MAG: DNA primase [Gammaproteobacteria bacterium]|nr:DNA primase [Gammaproteobacteria bacterium]
MAGKIPPQFIDELINRIDIVDLVNSRVPLKKTGKEYQACCPFHDEKTPSFTVSPSKQFYHCFGCGAHGTAIGFLMEYDNLGFVETVEELASRAGMEVPREQGASPGKDLRPLNEILNQSGEFYQQQLRKHPKAPSAVDYLKQRGLTGEICQAFGIGYAPPGWDNLLKRLGSDQQSIEHLKTSGMVTEPEPNKRYDRFRDRIMFPIRDHRGQVVGFGGRVLGDDKPKYLNSPETPLFHKGKSLYGLYEVRQAMRHIDRVMVVEGYMDVVALAQFGIRYAVATLGTATTPDHLALLFRTTPEIVFCFDGDRAGRDAGWKALITALPLMRDGREARFLFLPDGEDPDTLIRKEGQEAFEQRIVQATPLSEFLFSKLDSQVDSSSLDGKARLAELSKPLIQKLPNGIFRRMVEQRLGEIIGLSADKLIIEQPTENQFQEHYQRQKRPVRKGHGPQPTQTPVRLAISLLLQKPSLGALSDLNHDWLPLQAPGIDLLLQLLEISRNQPNLSAAQIVERWRDDPMFSHLNKLWQMGSQIPIPEEGMEAEFRGTLERLGEQQRKQEADQLLEKITRGEATESDKERYKQLLDR